MILKPELNEDFKIVSIEMGPWHAAARVGDTQVGEGAAVEGPARLALELLLSASVIWGTIQPILFWYMDII